MTAPHVALAAASGWTMVRTETLSALARMYAQNDDTHDGSFLDAVLNHARFNIGVERYYRSHEPHFGELPRRAWTLEGEGKVNIFFPERARFMAVVLKSMNAKDTFIQKVAHEFNFSFGALMMNHRWLRERAGRPAA